MTEITEEVEVQVQPQKAELKPGQYCWGTGRRKAAVARVRICPGSGKFEINKKYDVESYFSEPQHRKQVTAVLDLVGANGKLDVFVNVSGGGYTGQAGAILMGLARAMKEYDPATEADLRSANFLTRDPRQVERKKYGQRGARRRFQFSKR